MKNEREKLKQEKHNNNSSRQETAEDPDQTVPGEASPGFPGPEAAFQPEPETTPGSPADLSDLENKLREQTSRATEYWDRLLRTTADFENFKKRVTRERAEAARYANVSLVQSLLPLLDNLEMALAATDQANHESLQSLKTGVSMILQQFKSALAEAGLVEVDAQGQAFDPNLHEAVMQQEMPDVPEGQVGQQLRKGYRLHDRLLRPASVIVAKAPAAPSPPPHSAGDAKPA